MTDPEPPLSREDLRVLVQSTVRETLRELGVDARQALEMQRDMSFLRDLRKARDSGLTKAVVATVGMLVAAAFAAIAIGVRHWLNGQN